MKKDQIQEGEVIGYCVAIFLAFLVLQVALHPQVRDDFLQPSDQQQSAPVQMLGAYGG